MALSGVDGGSGGRIVFTEAATGGTAQVAVESGAVFDLSGLTAASLSLGSIAGAGDFFLGSQTLTVGSSNGSTVVAGVLVDGGLGGGSGAGLTKVGTGTLELGGVNGYTGATHVNAGRLLVTGSLANGTVGVAGDATLGGTGTIGGGVTVADAGIVSPGTTGAGTLTAGALSLSAGSVLTFQLGSASDRIDVNGALTLDGTIHVSALSGLTSGVYRLVNYSGVLTDNGLTLGTLPAGIAAADVSIQTSVPGQVNLVLNGGAGELLFWDGLNLISNGVVNGGTGTWTNALTNWTNSGGTINQAWAGKKAVFSGPAGAVTLGGNVSATGLQFVTNGYAVNAGAGEAISLDGAAVVRVEASAAATIHAALTGGALNKDGDGTLYLTASSGYGGGTTVTNGTLIVRDPSGLGLGTGPVAVRGTLTSLLRFPDNASLGALTITNDGSGPTLATGFTQLTNAARAATSAITNLGNSASGGIGGILEFRDSALAEKAVIENRGAGFASAAHPFENDAGGQTRFLDTSSAGAASIMNRGGREAGLQGGRTQFFGSSTAAQSTLMVEGGADGGLGGSIQFRANATGGTARVIFQPGGAADGLLDISGTNFTALTIGSVEGNGRIALGSKRIELGGNNLDAAFAGSIDGSGGSLRKVGTGMQTMEGSSSYTGGTVVADGELRVTNPGGFALGTGPVTVQTSPTSELRFSLTGSAGALAITNASGAAEVSGLTTFRSSATAATATITNSAAAAAGAIGGQTGFYGTSTAANSTINNIGTSFAGGSSGAEVTFYESATAGAATIFNGGGSAANAEGGQATFLQNSGAGTANITNARADAAGALPGTAVFRGSATAGAATIRNAGAVGANVRGGLTEFYDSATGGTAQLILEAGFSANTLPAVARFLGTSSADRAVITVSGSALGGGGSSGLLEFFVSATAGDATIRNARSSGNSGGLTKFTGSSHAGTSDITNEGAQTGASTYGLTEFRETSSAQGATLHNGASLTAGAFGGRANFHQSSKAGTALFDNEGAKVTNGYSGEVFFHDDASADGSTIHNRGSTAASATQGAIAYFFNRAKAGTATIVNEGGAVAGAPGSVAFFFGNSTAENAILRGLPGLSPDSGGRFVFSDLSDGGTARVILEGSGPAAARLVVNVSDAGLGLGSIEGGGGISLQGRNLTVGSNNLSTHFSGVIGEGGAFTGGSLTKVGAGTLRLTGDHTYTGITSVLAGQLVVSGSMAGAAVVQGGILGGNGAFNGGVTVGPGGIIAPGESIGSFSTLGALALGNGAVYGLEIDSSTGTADRITAVRVSIGAGVGLLGREIGTGVAQAGQVFRIIDNTSADPIAGTFAGLPEGASLTIGNNVFRISYQSGDGNDATLTQIGTDAYWQWAAALNGLEGDDAAANADPDHDGVPNLIEFVLGGQPNPAGPNAASAVLLPALEVTPTGLVFTYRRSDLSFARPGIIIHAEYGSDLTGWTAAQQGVAGVIITTIDDGFEPGVDRVQVSIPRPPVPGPLTFVRLSVSL
jgi:fibronectin-binding autotransporter adhesin